MLDPQGTRQTSVDAAGTSPEPSPRANRIESMGGAVGRLLPTFIVRGEKSCLVLYQSPRLGFAERDKAVELRSQDGAAKLSRKLSRGSNPDDGRQFSRVMMLSWTGWDLGLARPRYLIGADRQPEAVLIRHL